MNKLPGTTVDMIMGCMFKEEVREMRAACRDWKKRKAAWSKIDVRFTFQEFNLCLPRSVREVVFPKNISDADLVHLAPCTNLRTLDLSCCEKITDAGISQLVNVTTLKLMGLPITHAGLSNLVNLRELNLVCCRLVDNSNIRFIAELPLTSLSFGNCGVDDGGLPYLASMQQLKHFSMCTVDVTNAGMHHLAKLVNLETFNVDCCTHISDFSCVHAMILLRKLQVRFCPISEAPFTNPCLEHLDLSFNSNLKNFDGFFPPNLTNLDLSSSPVSTDVMHHAAKLPKLRILNLTDCAIKTDWTTPLSPSMEILSIGGNDVSSFDFGLLPNNLRVLGLDETSITDSTLEQLSHFKLETLDIRNCPNVTAAGFAHLPVSLTSLNVGYSILDDGWFLKLHLMTNLTSLDLSHCVFTAAQFTCLGTLVNLRNMNLDSASMCDEKLVHIVAFPNLETLSLSSNPFTSFGFSYVARLAKLKGLLLASCPHSSDTWLDLLANHPNLEWLHLYSFHGNMSNVRKALKRLPRLQKVNMRSPDDDVHQQFLKDFYQ